MDRERFDALTRLLGAGGSRRNVLGAVLGASLFGNGFAADAKKGKKKNNKKKKKHNRPTTCFGTEICQFPSDGLEFEDCNLAFTTIDACNGCDFRRANLGNTDLSEGSFQGVSFREANLRSANLEDADVSGASFRDACLAGANFLGANLDGADFRDAILCGTTLSDGAIDDSGCDDTDDCCPPAPVACLKEGDCPALSDTCCAGRCCPGGCDCAALAFELGQACIEEFDCSLNCEEDTCPRGFACIDDGACGFVHCHPLCGFVGVESRSSRRGQPHRRS